MAGVPGTFSFQPSCADIDPRASKIPKLPENGWTCRGCNGGPRPKLPPNSLFGLPSCLHAEAKKLKGKKDKQAKAKADGKVSCSEVHGRWEILHQHARKIPVCCVRYGDPAGIRHHSGCMAAELQIFPEFQEGSDDSARYLRACGPGNAQWWAFQIGKRTSSVLNLLVFNFLVWLMRIPARPEAAAMPVSIQFLKIAFGSKGADSSCDPEC